MGLIHGTVGIKRRTVLKGSLLATWASMASGFPEGRQRSEESRFLDANQKDSIAAICDTMIPRTDTPGALDAGVPSRLEALLRTWASKDTEAKMMRIVDEIDMYAFSKHGNSIAEIDSVDQRHILTAYDNMHRSESGYQMFKGMIFALYYMSEAGATEELVYEHSPGAWEASLELNSGVRASAWDMLTEWGETF